jgi:hypothetical protein
VAAGDRRRASRIVLGAAGKRSEMQTTTKTMRRPRADRAAKQNAEANPKIDIELRAEDGQLVQVQVP